MPTLFALSLGPDIHVRAGSVLVGRDPRCDVLLSSRRVSRRHCIICRVHDALVVYDLDSANGTTVNGNRVWCARLSPGDEVSIADMRFQLGADGTHGVALVE
jgi:pSer/pThr/pTyr-binding forkhead associated (FHA) protein